MNGHTTAPALSKSSERQIRCPAHTLSQFKNKIIRSLVPDAVFGRAYRYFVQRRVRVIYAGGEKLLAEVEGDGSLYQQTIRLADGRLLAACSCHSDEQPLCRHCVAALLAYHRLVPAFQEEFDSFWQGTFDKRSIEGWLSGQPTERDSSPATGLHETTAFIDWLQAAVAALKAEQPLPVASRLGPGDASGWAHTIQELAESACTGKKEVRALREEMAWKEGQLCRLALELEAMRQQVAETRGGYEAVKLEVETCREVIKRLGGAEQERERLVSEIGR